MSQAIQSNDAAITASSYSRRSTDLTAGLWNRRRRCTCHRAEGDEVRDHLASSLLRDRDPGGPPVQRVLPRPVSAS
jgi:hypothetical protein